MKKFENISDFEKLLKDQLDGHTTPAPKDVWSNVAASTSQGAGLITQISAYFSSVTNILKVALFAGGIASIGIVIFNENQPEVPEIESTTPVQSIEDNLDTSAEEVSENDQQPTEIRTRSESNNNQEKKSDSQADKETVAIQIEKEHLKSNELHEKNINNSSSTEEKDESNNLAEVFTVEANISNTTPCIGDEIELTSNRAGMWYLNDTPISSLGTSSKFTAQLEGNYQLKFRSQDFTETFTIQALSNKIEIVEGIETDGLKEFSLSSRTNTADWYLDDELMSRSTNGVSLKVLKVGNHVLRAESKNASCPSSSEYQFEIKPTGSIKTFNVFTPNGDGRNDTYVVEIENYEFFSIQIFDNQMNLLFASQNPNNEWDGSNQRTGKEAPSGEYLAKINYKLSGEEPSTKNIRLTLKRP
ncbi:MAG: gliding motility-associated C-terminal domain-containing protein [Bacteroidia bacterium]